MSWISFHSCLTLKQEQKPDEMKTCNKLPVQQLIIFLITITIAMKIHAQHNILSSRFSWSQATILPDPEGFAGPYVGVSGGALIFAGGSNFPGNKRPWDNATKVWYDKIFALNKPAGQWKEAGKLPRAMGYGIALPYQDEILCLGGGDTKQNYSDVFFLSYRGGKIKISYLPPMPSPLINACGVIAHDVVYVMGGIYTPSGQTENNFWSLDLAVSKKEQKWKVMKPLPGPSRMLATAGEEGGHIYLFGGAHLFPAGNMLQRQYLKDCWDYDIKNNRWKRIADLPYTLAAAPSPAYAADRFHLLLFGGDDGANAQKIFELRDRHPGFRNEILSYNCGNDTWTVIGRIPVNKRKDSITNPHASRYAPVTTPLVLWNGNIILAGGEARPGVRSNRVLIAHPQVIKKHKQRQ